MDPDRSIRDFPSLDLEEIDVIDQLLSRTKGMLLSAKGDFDKIMQISFENLALFGRWKETRDYSVFAGIPSLNVVKRVRSHVAKESADAFRGGGSGAGTSAYAHQRKYEESVELYKKLANYLTSMKRICLRWAALPTKYAVEVRLPPSLVEVGEKMPTEEFVALFDVPYTEESTAGIFQALNQRANAAGDNHWLNQH